MTNTTKKVQYHATLITWAEITTGFERADVKTKARLESRGQIIYMECDEGEKAKLRAAETEKLSLKGYEYVPLRTKLIGQILETIAHESTTAKI